MDFQSACCCPQCTRTYAAVPMAPRLASAAMLSESLSRLRTAERKEAVTCASKTAEVANSAGHRARGSGSHWAPPQRLGSPS